MRRRSNSRREGAWLCFALAAVAAIGTLLLRAQPDPAVAATVLFSDGFESGNFSQWSSVTVAADATATVQSNLVHSGGYAARLSSTSNGSARAFASKSLQPERADLRAEGAFNVQAEGASGGNVPFLRFFDAAGNRLVSLYRQNGNGGLWVKHSGATIRPTRLSPSTPGISSAYAP